MMYTPMAHKFLYVTAVIDSSLEELQINSIF